jgi:DNA-binding response OmpR family regulator
MNESEGRRILVIEDEGPVALMIEDMLIELGFEIAASIARIGEAERRAPTIQADLAILDVNLDGHPVFPVARILHERGMPFIFSTGYGGGSLPPEFAHCAVLAKPFALADLQRALRSVLVS